MHSKILPKAVQHWGTLKAKQKVDQDAVSMRKGLLWEGDCTWPARAADSSSPADAVLIPETAVLERLPGEVLPSDVKVRPEFWQIKLPVLPTGPRVVPAEANIPQVPLPLELILAQPDPDNISQKEELPLAAILTDRRGIVVYDKPQFNNGDEWQQAIAAFFGTHRDIATAVVKAIQDHQLRKRSLQGMEPKILVVEIVGHLQ
jgi:hypothetical protein